MRQQTLYKGCYYPLCVCFVEQHDLTEEAYDPADKMFMFDKIIEVLTVQIPNTLIDQKFTTFRRMLKGIKSMRPSVLMILKP